MVVFYEFRILYRPRRFVFSALFSRGYTLFSCWDFCGFKDFLCDKIGQSFGKMPPKEPAKNVLLAHQNLMLPKAIAEAHFPSQAQELLRSYNRIYPKSIVNFSL